jgi:beta-glucosidase
LSYTTFAYADIDVTVHSDYSIQIDFTLQNVGFVDGAEVAQAYLSAPSAAGLMPPPPQSLAGFQKVHLAAGEKRRVSITVLPRASQRWSVSQHQWQRVSGDYVVKVGASSRDHRLQRKFVL